jgi:NTP pyrophosphatase (non-canonical NTP hydrolase)
MNLSEYQELTLNTAIYPHSSRVLYPLLGLLGETGELANKLKKVFRDDKQNELSVHSIPSNVYSDIKGELGDILWYLARFADDLKINLDDVMQENLDKLKSRRERGVLGGSGDNR